MIVCNSRRYIFVHIPKTGGSAISAALEPTLDPRFDFFISETKDKAKWASAQSKFYAHNLGKHARLADLAQYFPEEIIRNYQVFTIVRNPYDRAVSLYFWLKSYKKPSEWTALAKSLPFAEFMRSDLIVRNFKSHNCAHYFRLPSGAEYCHRTLRYENLQAGFDEVMDRMSLPRHELPKVNASKRHPDYRKYIDAETRDYLTEIFAPDLERFGYEF